VFDRRHVPSLDGANEWLNTEPLSHVGLRGHVVLVDFWTLTRINWLRTEPYVRAWSQVYQEHALVVIGVHTPEFSFEHEIERVRLATKDRGIDYPVAVDNDCALSGVPCGRSGSAQGRDCSARAFTSELAGHPETRVDQLLQVNTGLDA